MCLPLAGAMTQTASAQELPPAVIAVVDEERILNEASAYQSIVMQLTTIRDTYQAELDTQKQMLEEMDSELLRQRSILAPEVFEQKQREFERRVDEFETRVQQITIMIDRAHSRAVREIQVSLSEIVDELSQERGFTFLLPTSQVVYMSKELDVSDEVLRRLDERLPRVEVVLDEG